MASNDNPNDNKETVSEEPTAKAEPLPKDRNQRVREQAARKLAETKQGAAARQARVSGLDAGEMVDDALARGFASFTRWLRNNRRAVEIGVVVAIAGGAGYALWDWYAGKQQDKASAALVQGLRTEGAVVLPPAASGEEPPPELKAQGITTFKSYSDLRDAALQAYRQAADQHKGTGPGILARLGSAGVLLEQRKFDEALQAYQQVLATDLAKADTDVRMSAIEGLAFAQEGKGDLDAATKTLQQLQQSNIDYYKHLGMYHEARLLVARGDTAAAKEKLETIRKQLAGSGLDKPRVGQEYVLERATALLRQIDPSAAPPVPAGGMGELTPEQLQRLQEQILKMNMGNVPPAAPAQGHPEAPTGSAAPAETAPAAPVAPTGSAPAGNP